MYGKHNLPWKQKWGDFPRQVRCPHWASGVDLRAVGVVHGGLHHIFLAEQNSVVGDEPDFIKPLGMPWNKDI